MIFAPIKTGTDT